MALALAILVGLPVAVVLFIALDREPTPGLDERLDERLADYAHYPGQPPTDWPTPS